jgi:hypothetical protein
MAIMKGRRGTEVREDCRLGCGIKGRTVSRMVGGAWRDEGQEVVGEGSCVKGRQGEGESLAEKERRGRRVSIVVGGWDTGVCGWWSVVMVFSLRRCFDDVSIWCFPFSSPQSRSVDSWLIGLAQWRFMSGQGSMSVGLIRKITVVKTLLHFRGVGGPGWVRWSRSASRGTEAPQLDELYKCPTKVPLTKVRGA